MTRTAELAEWITRATYRDFPQETIDKAKGLLLKTVAGMLVGSREPISKILTTYFSASGGPPEAGVVGSGFRAAVDNAAFANATFAHASELEDNELPNITSDYWMFPAIFPLAEKQVSSGREVIESAIIAWETASRYCRAGSGWLYLKVHICPPSWFGTVGVAAAGSRLLKMTAKETEHALCMAGSFSSGLGGGGSDTHFLESGHTCQMGMRAAILAKAGATSNPEQLELPYSFFAPVWAEGKVNMDIINAGLGKPPYAINQACIKKYSACTYTHTSIDALVMLMKENNIKYEDVEQVETQIGEFGKDLAVGVHPDPADLLEARFSMEYLLGEVLLRTKVDVNTFVGEEKLSDPKHKEAERKVKIGRLMDLQYADPGAQVTVVLKNGRKLVKRLDSWIGSPEHPLSLEQVRDVCRPYLEVMLDRSQCDRVEELVLNLEKQPDVIELMDIICFSRVGRRARA